MLTDERNEMFGVGGRIAVGVIDRDLNLEGNLDNLDVEIDFRTAHVRVLESLI